jgi:hypothetical protein
MMVAGEPAGTPKNVATALAWSMPLALLAMCTLPCPGSTNA